MCPNYQPHNPCRIYTTSLIRCNNRGSAATDRSICYALLLATRPSILDRSTSLFFRSLLLYLGTLKSYDLFTYFQGADCIEQSPPLTSATVRWPRIQVDLLIEDLSISFFHINNCDQDFSLSPCMLARGFTFWSNSFHGKIFRVIFWTSVLLFIC